MRKIIVLLSFMFVFIGAGFAAESILKISRLSGEVECSLSGGDWKPAVLNQELTTNDKVQTKNGKAELLFAEGTTVKLKENTLLDLLKIQCAEQKQNSSLKLIFGGLKAKVTKLFEGGSFDIQSPKIIAAVKGTEFVMNTTAEITELQVLEGIVSISDLLKEKEIFVKENERAAFRDGFLENPRQMDPSEIIGIRDGFDLSGRPVSGFQSRSAGLSAANAEKEVKEMRELRNDLAELKDRSNLEAKQDLLERISDVQLGKSTIDMHGYRVRTDNYVLRPQPNVLQLLNLTKREGGPDAGLSSFEINDTFNKALPDNYMDVKIAIQNSTNGIILKANGTPDLWLTQETAAIRNPSGDVILDLVDLNTPVLNPNSSMYDQDFKEVFQINSNIKWIHDYGYTAHGNDFYMDASLQTFNSHGAYSKTNLPYTTVPPTYTNDGLGGYLTKDIYSDNTFLEKSLYLVDDNGVVHSVVDVFNTLGEANFQAGLLNYNWEMIYSASEFNGRKIDILVLPRIFGQLF